ncbi:MAG: methylated-DNA--[protein]-cysteine S-methyltransferase [Bdellovibrionaceae bacterium]|nr:methylated-DNA--[protein]-cysteine S-methyltransferase [Pseudobdellovibrionaceae bacterium]
MSLVEKKINTLIGTIYIVASETGLKSVGWEKSKNLAKHTSTLKDQPKSVQELLLETEKQLNEFFSGTRKTFDLPLDPEGTLFQKKVWKQLSRIPFGTTKSYKDIATAINNAKAYRAVGSANGKNPICIIIPCHRVIAADGSIGGYSGGLHYKKKLLKMEASK